MRVVVFNDTRVDWTLHTRSERGAKGENCIPKHSGVIFEGPDGSEAFVKVWGKVVMVRFVRPGELMPTGVPPHRRISSRSHRSRMLSDAERMDIEHQRALGA